MGFDGVLGVAGDVLACLSQLVEVLGVDGELIYWNVIGSLLGVGPSQDGIGCCVQDIFGVGAGQVGREGHVEGVVDEGVGSLRGYRRCSLVRNLLMGRWHRWHGVPRWHSEGRAHPL